MWGRMVRTSPHVPSTPKVTLVIKKNDDDSSILLKKEREKKIWCIYETKKEKKRAKKQREKENDIYKKEKKRRRRCRKTCAPILDLCYYHQGPWSMHTNCVCGLVLLLAWEGPCAIKPHLQQFQASSIYAASKSTQVCKCNIHQHLYSYFVSIWFCSVHAFLVYVVFSGWVYSHGPM